MIYKGSDVTITVMREKINPRLNKVHLVNNLVIFYVNNKYFIFKELKLNHNYHHSILYLLYI